MSEKINQRSSRPHIVREARGDASENATRRSRHVLRRALLFSFHHRDNVTSAGHGPIEAAGRSEGVSHAPIALLGFKGRALGESRAHTEARVGRPIRRRRSLSARPRARGSGDCRSPTTARRLVISRSRSRDPGGGHSGRDARDGSSSRGLRLLGGGAEGAGLRGHTQFGVRGRDGCHAAEQQVGARARLRLRRRRRPGRPAA
jgi:hypothetical protein